MNRWVLLVVLGAILATGCDVQVKERFRDGADEASTSTTEVEAVELAPEATSTTVRTAVGSGVAIPEGAVEATAELILTGRQVDMSGTLDWFQQWSTSTFDVTFASDIDLELILLRVDELERLGVITEDNPDDVHVRWYAVVGTVRHALRDSACVPVGAAESCEIASVRDGDLAGLASREADVVNIALRWKGQADRSVPSIGMSVTDSTGNSMVTNHELVRVSLEASRLVGGRGTSVEVGAESGRALAARGGEGTLVIVDSN